MTKVLTNAFDQFWRPLWVLAPLKNLHWGGHGPRPPRHWPEGRRQVKTEQSDTRCQATQSKIETENNVNNKQSDLRHWARQSKQYLRRKAEGSHERAEWLDDNYRYYIIFCSCWWWSTILNERFCTFLVKRERVSELPLAGNPMFEQFEVDYYLTDNTTVHPNT